MVALVIVLTGCGSGMSAQDFIWLHTACTPAYYSLPFWSSDGSRIFYGIGPVDGRGIHSMSRSGGDDRLLVPESTFPQPSPDGRWLLYSVDSYQAPSYSQPSSYSVLDLATGQTRALGDLGNYTATWSTDGKWIAYLPSTGGPIMKLDPASGQATPLGAWTWPTSGTGNLQWSPDAQTIAFNSNQDGQYNLYLLAADGSALNQLTFGGDACPSIGYRLPLAWRPDGQALFYTSTCGNSATLNAIALDGAEVGFPSLSYEGINGMAWSPDGSRVLIFYRDDGPKAAVANADGSDLHDLPSLGVFAHWSPDGKQILFTGKDQSGLDQIYVINPDGSNLTQLTSNPGAGTVCLH
jgi:TolB protein